MSLDNEASLFFHGSPATTAHQCKLSFNDNSRFCQTGSLKVDVKFMHNRSEEKFRPKASSFQAELWCDSIMDYDLRLIHAEKLPFFYISTPPTFCSFPYPLPIFFLLRSLYHYSRVISQIDETWHEIEKSRRHILPRFFLSRFCLRKDSWKMSLRVPKTLPSF